MLAGKAYPPPILAEGLARFSFEAHAGERGEKADAGRKIQPCAKFCTGYGAVSIVKLNSIADYAAEAVKQRLRFSEPNSRSN